MEEILLQKAKEFKERLDAEAGFSTREKDILFENYVKYVVSSGDVTGTPVVLAQAKPLTDKAVSNNIGETFASLVNQTKISQHADYVLFAIYRLVIQGEMESVAVRDILGEYRSAYLKPSSNTNVFIQTLVQRGLIMSVGKKDGAGAFTVTNNGISYVEEKIKNAG